MSITTTLRTGLCPRLTVPVVVLWLAASACGAQQQPTRKPDTATQPRISSPYPISRDVAAGDTYMGVRLLGALKLDPVQIDGFLLGGLSALGWDNDEQVLYALSDRGYFFHLRLEFDDDGVLVAAHAVHAYALLDARGKALRGRLADSEGLVVRNGDNNIAGDTQLAVSFERRPRIIRFDARGNMIGAEALPARLRKLTSYPRGNRALESIAWHPVHHYLTAPEIPLRDSAAGEVPLYAIASQQFWRYPLAPEPNAALTAIEVLPDASVLTLERGYGVFFIPVISTLRRITALPEEPGVLLEPQTVARFSSGQGWSLDNFEGLASLGDGRVLMVSDDNTRPIQSTLLMAVQLLDSGSGANR